MVKMLYQVDNRCPVRLQYLYDLSTSAVNAVTVCTGTPWQEVVRLLMEQARLRACMPTYVTCVTDMMRVSGFASLPRVKTAEELLAVCGEEETEAEWFIAKTASLGYCALTRLPGGDGFQMHGLRPGGRGYPGMSFDSCWVYVPGSDNRTGIKRTSFVMPGVTAPHKALAVTNMNPQDHNVGDCSVRALCAALECTWEEAIDLLAGANRYTDPVINTTFNINNALIGLSFERHRAIVRNGRRLTGKQFCDQMTYTFHNGERIFAFVGRSHCAAVLPFREEDGTVRYKTQDTWDSTDKTIGDYWVIPPRERRERLSPPARAEAVSCGEVGVGSVITHPKYGRGTVTAENGGVLTVAFENAGEKKLSAAWLKKQCGRG
ncbi:MAG: hypothetical protein IJK98_05515 [Clostridia bacterium]|nr:hypothetical protein [Clostridia bacterium]